MEEPPVRLGLDFRCGAAKPRLQHTYMILLAICTNERTRTDVLIPFSSKFLKKGKYVFLTVSEIWSLGEGNGICHS